jgi:hypothetical protein
VNLNNKEEGTIFNTNATNLQRFVIYDFFFFNLIAVYICLAAFSAEAIQKVVPNAKEVSTNPG